MQRSINITSKNKNLKHYKRLLSQGSFERMFLTIYSYNVKGDQFNLFFFKGAILKIMKLENLQELLKDAEKYEDNRPYIRFPYKYFCRCILIFHLSVFVFSMFLYGMWVVVPITTIPALLVYLRLFLLRWKQYKLSRLKLYGYLFFTSIPIYFLAVFVRKLIFNV